MIATALFKSNEWPILSRNIQIQFHLLVIARGKVLDLDNLFLQ